MRPPPPWRKKQHARDIHVARHLTAGVRQEAVDLVLVPLPGGGIVITYGDSTAIAVVPLRRSAGTGDSSNSVETVGNGDPALSLRRRVQRLDRDAGVGAKGSTSYVRVARKVSAAVRTDLEAGTTLLDGREYTTPTKKKKAILELVTSNEHCNSCFLLLLDGCLCHGTAAAAQTWQIRKSGRQDPFAM